jgi:chromosome segregation ATPase
LSYEHSPEERLKRYKASLDKMAKEEGRNLKSTKNVPKTAQSKDKETVNPVSAKSKKTQSREPQIKPPQELVSPAKKELGESIATVRKSPKASSRAKDKESDGRNFLMLKVRLGSIESGLRDIKKRRETLEAQLKSKYIDRKKYQEEMTALVAEGRKLLVEKERVEKEMKQLKPR